MRSSTSISPDEARELLRLSQRFTLTELKTAFRTAAKQYHPDASDQSSSEQFIKANQAYELLLNHTSEGVSSIPCTDDGTPLYKLGLGLGPTVNGKDCETCQHLGYRSYRDQERVVCTDCDHNGIQWVIKERCRACQNGKFKQLSGRVVDCRACSGTGIFKRELYNGRLCTTCMGLKYRTRDSGQTRYSKCWTCDGTGEIRIFNPAFPKGLLMRSAS